MPNRLTTADVVWLMTLKGATTEECWRAANENAGRRMSRKYVGCLRHELYRTITYRFARWVE